MEGRVGIRGGGSEDGLLKEGGGGGVFDLLRKVEYFESCCIVLVADGREERGVAISIARTEL